MSCGRDGTLIIGYGNVMRGDDSVGVRTVLALRNLGVPAIDVHQLLPEMAEIVAAADRAIFIDADVSLAPGEVRVFAVEAANPGVMEHHATPANLMSLARDIYGHAPEAVIVAIGGQSDDFGDAVSKPAEKGIQEAVKLCMNQDWWKN